MQKRKRKNKVSLEDKVSIAFLCSITLFIFTLLIQIIYFIVCLLQAIL